ncbi:hypothetical protein FACS189487_01130 [Campylobacterota bacterium]|nr:hypothetical protein FACS189487_01130 [Campylobacterota bacterium]
MLADDILLGFKYQSTIEAYAELVNVDLRTATDVFYKSRLYIEMSEGISDMHCRSDGYLAEELKLEIESIRIDRSDE